MTDPKSHLRTIPAVVRQMIADAADEHGVTVEALLSERLSRHLTGPRQALYAAVYDLRWPSGSRRFSMPDVARFLGRKDHTCVLHGIRAHTKRMQEAA